MHTVIYIRKIQYNLFLKAYYVSYGVAFVVMPGGSVHYFADY